jgi:hypothetical protein
MVAPPIGNVMFAALAGAIPAVAMLRDRATAVAPNPIFFIMYFSY